MLSSRGAMSMQTVLEQAVSTRPRNSKTIITHQEMQRVWAAACNVLRAQLLLGHSVTICKHSCAFWYKQQHVVTDGNTKYYRRVPCFGFNQHFATTYSLDTIIEREDLHTPFHRLPLEYIAAEARVGAEHAQTILHELFLFIGEALYQGKMLALDFANVATVLVKRERANISFANEFLEDVFTIDSRKWPLAVREVGARTPLKCGTPRPTSSASSRPSSARPRSSSSCARPLSSSATPRPLPERPSFVSAAASGKLFRELEKQPSRRPPSAANKKTTAGKGPLKPVKALQPSALAAADPNANMEPLGSAKKPLPMPESNDEESVYSLLTPQRMRDVAPQPEEDLYCPNSAPQYEEHADDNEMYDEEDYFPQAGGGVVDDDDADVYATTETFHDQPEHTPRVHFEGERGSSRPVSAATSRPASSCRPYSHHKSNVFFVDPAVDEDQQKPMHYGRKRVAPLSGASNDIRSILTQKPSSTSSPYNQQLRAARPALADHVASLMHD